MMLARMQPARALCVLWTASYLGPDLGDRLYDSQQSRVSRRANIWRAAGAKQMTNRPTVLRDGVGTRMSAAQPVQYCRNCLGNIASARALDTRVPPPSLRYNLMVRLVARTATRASPLLPR